MDLTGSGSGAVQRELRRLTDSGLVTTTKGGYGWADTRAIQQYMGHRNIRHTVRYTELAPERFKGFVRD
jgi:hypothetical protein